MKSFSALTRSASSFQPSILLRNRSLNQISNRQISSCINRGVIAPSTSNLIPTSSTSTSSVNRFYLQTRFKSKKSKATSPTPSASDDDVPVMHTKGKGKKSGIGKESSDDSYSTSTRNDELPGEKFDIKKLTSNMANSLERANKTVSSMIGGHGRADPGLLDPVKVSYPGGGGDESHPLRDFATVGVRDGALLVTLFDQEMLKHVERAIYTADLGLIPQTIPNGDEFLIRVPIPRPTAETRAALLKDVSRICENARVSIRSARHTGQKQLKSDVDNKVVGTSEAKKEGQQLEAEAKKHTAKVDSIFEQAKKKLDVDT